MKPTILFDSKNLTDTQKNELKKNNKVNVDLLSPRNEMFTLFGAGLAELPEGISAKLQVCIASDPDSEKDLRNQDTLFTDMVMFGQAVELDVNNTVVNLEMTGHFRLVIPKLAKNKRLVIGFY